MSRPTKTVIDCSTGVSTEIELTDEEIAERERQAEIIAARQAELEAENALRAQAKASAQAKLTALGLSEDEVAALVG